jgi:peptidoglycan/xylan/chitin deacetylase (PgdA/CDA1 family)
MRINNTAMLEAIFLLQGNFKTGVEPGHRVVDGIEIAPFKNAARAAVCISADFEMSWAFRHHAQEVAREKGRRERENVPYLLQIFEDYAFPITWATIGHLFLESCTKVSGGLAHSDMPRPAHNQLWAGDWYVHDPCTDYKKDPLWYAPDLIQRILESPVSHEIGTHSFSHIDFLPVCSDPILVRREIEESALAMQHFGIRPRSLVYPFNHMGHAYLDLLSELSITTVRHRDQHVRLSYPERTPSGVYKFYESMNLRTPKHYDYLDKVKIFLAKAAERHSVFHLWFHPSDPLPLFESEFLRIIQYIDSQRQEGRVWVATMAEIAAYCEARERLGLEVTRKGNRLSVIWRGSFQSEKYGDTELSLVFPPLPRPRMVTIINGDSSRHLELGCSYIQTTTGQLLINMPTAAQSLHIVF